jgi:predicted metal-dependent hydrolase
MGKPAFAYTIRKHPRAKRLTISVHADGRVVVTIPKRASLREAERFIEEKKHWITRTLAAHTTTIAPAEARARYLEFREDARRFAVGLVERWSARYGVDVSRISIRNQRSCWGSCTRRGTLNFNYQILFLPPHLANYIVVHEICHLLEFNHSRRFWALVEKGIPEYPACRRELRAWRPNVKP